MSGWENTNQASKNYQPDPKKYQPDPKHISTRSHKNTIQTEKIVQNIENCSNHISKGSRSMFVRQPDIFFYIVNKVVKI